MVTEKRGFFHAKKYKIDMFCNAYVVIMAKSICFTTICLEIDTFFFG